MPTAVERSFFDFLKIEDFAPDHFLKLDSVYAFLKIGDDIQKLSHAGDHSFLKIEDNHKIQHDFKVVSDFVLKQGDGLTEIAGVALKIDEVIVKLMGGDTNIGSATGGAGAGKISAPQADFLKLDQGLATTGADLKIFAADFLKLDHSSSARDYKINLTTVIDDFLKLDKVFAGDQDAFLKLDADFLKIADASDPTAVDLALKNLGGELHKVSNAFGGLANDFLKLSEAFGDGSVRSAGGSASLGHDFLSLEIGFLKLDSGLGHLGGATGALIGLLTPNPTGVA